MVERAHFESFPSHLQSLVESLASMKGVVAVVLGGSRAEGTAVASSDWDLGLYYQGELDTSHLAAFGTVYAPGAWGRVMNGGAWLTVRGDKVDVLFRDLDTVSHWSRAAGRGEFEIDALLGYVAGVPTYSLAAERAIAVLLRGDLPTAEPFSAALATSASSRWEFCSKFSLDYARMHARRGDRIGVVGQASKAVFEAAHARMAANRRWVLNEKRLVQNAGIHEVQSLFERTPSGPRELAEWIDELDRRLAP